RREARPAGSPGSGRSRAPEAGPQARADRSRRHPRPVPQEMSRAILTLLAICLACAAYVRIAHAEDTTTRAAKRHYDRGQKLFALQKFDEALDQFQQAFDAKPIPDFLFNIGQCQRNLGDYESAIFSFKRYLKLSPHAE